MPTTPEGRSIWVALIVCGIGVFGNVTGVMAAYLQAPDDDEALRRLARIEAKLQELGRGH